MEENKCLVCLPAFSDSRITDSFLGCFGLLWVFCLFGWFLLVFLLLFVCMFPKPGGIQWIQEKKIQ